MADFKNEWQRIACKVYPHDDLLPVDVEDAAAVAQAVQARETGDTLFDFVYLELAEADIDQEEAVRRIRKAADDLTLIADTLDQW